MPLKGALKKFASQNADEIQQAKTMLEKKLADIGKMPDAGDRYLALVELKKEANSLDQSFGKKIDKQATGKNLPTNISGGIVCVQLIASMGIVIACPPLALVGALGIISAIPVLGTGVFIESSNTKKSKIFLDASGAESFLNYLHAIWQKADTQKKELEKNQMSALTTSPRFGEIFDKFPQIFSDFAKASAQKERAAKMSRDAGLTPPTKPES